MLLPFGSITSSFVDPTCVRTKVDVDAIPFSYI